jgi:hypothetical protein
LGGAKYRQILTPTAGIHLRSNKKEMKTMSVNNNNPKIDLSGVAPQLGNLPDGLFDCNEALALTTFAALCCSPNVKLGDNEYFVSINSLALRNLALFAAGGQVFYHREDFRDLERLAHACSNDTNHHLVSWVLRCAYDRAKSLGIVGPGTAGSFRVEDARYNGLSRIEPEDGRGYGLLGEDLADELFHDSKPSRRMTAEEALGQAEFERWSPSAVASEDAEWKRKRLVTYAAVMSALKPRLCTQPVEAVVFLALYGAGAEVELTQHQFEMLEMRAAAYLEKMCADRYANSRNRKMAEFALAAAQERARANGIVCRK